MGTWLIETFHLTPTVAFFLQLCVFVAISCLLLGSLFWMVRSLFRVTRPYGFRRTQNRLSVVSTLVVDPRRRLLLVKRDQKEHLLLIGGMNDVLVETGILSPSMQERISLEKSQQNFSPLEGGYPAKSVFEAPLRAPSSSVFPENEEQRDRGAIFDEIETAALSRKGDFALSSDQSEGQKAFSQEKKISPQSPPEALKSAAEGVGETLSDAGRGGEKSSKDSSAKKELDSLFYRKAAVSSSPSQSSFLSPPRRANFPLSGDGREDFELELGEEKSFKNGVRDENSEEALSFSFSAPSSEEGNSEAAESLPSSASVLLENSLNTPHGPADKNALSQNKKDVKSEETPSSGTAYFSSKETNSSSISLSQIEDDMKKFLEELEREKSQIS